MRGCSAGRRNMEAAILIAHLGNITALMENIIIQMALTFLFLGAILDLGNSPLRMISL